MPARSEWKGYLQICQLQVAVKAFSASSTEPDIALNQLHRHCGERIRQQRICAVHGPLESDDIIPGYQVSEGHYIPLDPLEIEQLKPEPNKGISLECFVDSQTIDPVFHSGRTLYLVPNGPPDQRPFNVMREGMKLSRRHAFSRIVISGRERLVLVRPYGKLLAMTFIEYPQRVRLPKDYESEIADITPGAHELGIVKQLIETLTDRQFDLSKYRDEYMDRLSSLIEQRVAATDLMKESTSSSSESCDDQALLSILKASLAAAGVTDHGPGRSVDPLGQCRMENEVVEQKTA